VIVTTAATVDRDERWHVMQSTRARVSLFLTSVATLWCVSAAAPAVAAAQPACTITGTSGRDVLRGTPGDDVVCGQQGDDIIFGGGGRDVLRGGRGRDILYGQAGADALYAGLGRGDELHGEQGNDYLDARDGAPFDLLRGGSGENMCVADAEDHRRGCRHPLVPGMGEAVPILLYHVIGERPAGAPFPQLYVPASVFAAQMNERRPCATPWPSSSAWTSLADDSPR